MIINLYYKQKYIKRSILQYDNTLLVRKVFVLKDKNEKYIKWQVSKKKLWTKKQMKKMHVYTLNKACYLNKTQIIFCTSVWWLNVWTNTKK